MKKFLLVILFIVIPICFAYAFSVEVTPDFYEVTLNKVELYNNTTSLWVTLGEGNETFDLASVNVGQTVGGYVSNLDIPDGNYTKIKLRLSRTFRLQAQTTNGGTTYYTSSDNDPYADYGPAKVGLEFDDGYEVVAKTTGSPEVGETKISTEDISSMNTWIQAEGLGSMTADGDYFFLEVNIAGAPISFTSGISKKIKILFEVTGALDCDNESDYWGVGKVFFAAGGIKISIDVDGTVYNFYDI